VISAVVIQPDGKIVVAGGAYPLFTFAGDFKIARYNVNGSLDTSFGSGGIVTTVFPGDGSFAFALALQSDGKIIAAGTDFLDFHPGDMSNTDFALARYNPDGSLDATFGNGGILTTDFLGAEDDVYSVLIQPDGRIIAVGSANSPIDYYNFAAARYLANGALDPTFGTGGKVRTDFGNNDFDIAYAAALQPDGKIVAVGTTSFDLGVSQDFALLRYNSNGTLDTTFDGDGRLLIDFGSYLQYAYAVMIQPDGKIVTVGYPDTESDDSDFLLARCNPNGSLDSSFGVGGKVRTSLGDLNSGATAAVLQPDGRIVVAGFNPTGNASGVEFALARYLGTPPTTLGISGTITYCSNPSAPPLPGATLNLTGSMTVSTLSDTSGNYQFASLLPGGSYVVTPTKNALIPGGDGSNINTVDVVAMQRHFLRLGTPLTGCRLTGADVNSDTMVNTIDVIAVQRFFLGASTGIANTGTYKFAPTNRSYPSLGTNQINQNYDALVFGDVAAGFVHQPELPSAPESAQ
jgi:uncharacterized delta-60 repeat protein